MKVNVRASSLHASVVGLADTALQLVAAFGVHMSLEQDAAVTSFVNALLVLFSVAVIQATNGEAK